MVARLKRLLPALVALISAGMAPEAGAAIEVTDVAGRTITLEEPARRIVLGEGRFLAALGILDRERPLSRVVGMLNEFKRLDLAGYASFARRFPEIDDVPVFGQTSEASVSVEKIIALAPDVAVFGVRGHGPGKRSDHVIRVMEAAGVAIVFVDFRIDPLVNTPASIEVLGRVLGREQQAAAFVAFYRAQLEKVAKGLSDFSGERPTVLLEALVGLREECCFTMADGMMGRFVDFAGGHNIAKDVVPGIAGDLNLEYVLSTQPDFYIGTAIGSAAGAEKKPERIILGADVDAETARASLRRALARRGIETLDAAKPGRAFAIWHHFYNSPLNVYAVQAMAKWLHPERFPDLDPDATLKTLFRRFQPYPLSGTYAIGLE